MKKSTWVYWIAAVAMVLAGGAVLAFAGSDDQVGKMVTVNVNGDVDTFNLDDLADGETREIVAGDHTVTVTRFGDDLSVLLDGEEIDTRGIPDAREMIWFGDDGQPGDGEAGLNRKVVVMTGDDSEHAIINTVTIRDDCDDATRECETIDVDVMTDHPGIFAADGGDPDRLFVEHIGLHDGMVRYRCEETGSVLLVQEEDALSDSYICPATGCVMEKVTEPEVKVIKVRHRVKTEDEVTD